MVSNTFYCSNWCTLIGNRSDIKTLKTVTFIPTCFCSRRNHHQGAILCLAKTKNVVSLLYSSLQMWSMLWWHISLLCRRAPAQRAPSSKQTQGRIKLFGAPRQWKHFRPLFQAVFLSGGRVLPPRQSNTTPPSPKTEITNILFYILNFASIIKFKM